MRHIEVHETQYRMIIISDIHSHLDRFLELLDHVHYSQEDYLVIVGDFVEKGTQTLQMIDYLRELQQHNKKVIVLMGNCEYAILQLVCQERYASHMVHYVQHIGKSGMIHQAIDHLGLNIHDDPLMLQKQIKEYLTPYLDYLKSLPLTFHLPPFLCVHAGIENRQDWQNSSLSSMLEMRTFLNDGHCLNDYVVVGHLPTSNHYFDMINNDILIDEKKRIICLDGGTGVKMISQLNALIVNKDDHLTLTKEYVQPLPMYQVMVDIHQPERDVYKIAWPYFEVEVLKTGTHFSLCRQLQTEHQLRIKNEFLYQRDGKTYCLDDYIDCRLSCQKGDVVKLAGVYGPYGYVVDKHRVGWIQMRYLKPVKKELYK